MNVQISLDGMHGKTFDVRKFMSKNACIKADGIDSSWKGKYCVEGFENAIVIGGGLEQGDVRIRLSDGKLLYAECKKGTKRPSDMLPLMREAIGQIMTGCPMNENIISVVAVPYMEKTLEYVNKWSKLERIQKAGIRFILICENGEICEY